MDRYEVAAMLERNPNSKSVERAMAIVAQGHELVAVRAGGRDEDLERARREYPHASYITVLARGYTRYDDRIGVFVEQGVSEPRLF
ncbi:MAG: hypothetical protein ACOYOU_03085 [Kiritimatiellia bacterium]